MNSFLRLACVGAALTRLAPLVAGADDWWVKSPRDVAWTNRPLNEIKAAADGGDANAQFYFARARFMSSTRIEDWTESLKWVNRAAEAGLADAQFMAGKFYLSGTATERDPATGFKWAARSAEQGHPDGLALLADTYTTATGTTQNIAKARELYQRAVDAGSILGLDCFGHFYLSGEARTAPRTNYVEALRCFERAASNGMAHAATHLIGMYREGLGTPPNVERAVFWARTFADQGDKESMEALAGMYAGGLAEPRDAQDSPTVLLRRATEARARYFERDDSDSAPLRTYLTLVGNCRDLWNRYRFGMSTSRDYIASAQWMLVAYRQDVPRDRNKIPWQDKPLHPFADAAKATNSAASSEERLWQEALRLIHRSLEQADASTCRQIGLSYRDGSSLTPQDGILAHVWLSRAAELNDIKAHADLVELERSLSSDQIAQAKKRYLPKCKRPV